MSKPKAPSSKKKSLIIGISSTILFFFLLHAFLGHRVTLIDKVFSIAATPILWCHDRIVNPVYTKYQHYKDYQKLVAEKDFYKKQYVETQGKLIQHQAEYTFDQATDKLENFSKRYITNTGLLCRIVVQRLSDTEQIFVVNAGSAHGVTKNMIAIYGSTLLGKVADIYPYYSSIQLITDKRSRVSVYCSHTKSKGIVEGKNDKVLLSLSYVDCLQPLVKDDILISSGEGIIFPEGFGVGKIESYVPQDLHYTVSVTPCYDFTTIEYCYLIPYEQCSYTPIIKDR